MANAVFQRELKLGLRSQKAFLAQVVFVACLAAVIWLAWPKGERVGIEATLSSRIFHTLAASLFGLVTLLAPVFVAGSLTSEKEGGTLEMLIVSPVPPGAIAAGKHLAGVLYLALLVLSGLPVIGLCYFLGGVGGDEVLGLGLHLLGYTFLLGGIGLFASHRCERTHGALVVTYLASLPLGALTVWLASRWNPNDPAGFLGTGTAVSFVVLEGVVFLILYAMVVAGLTRPPSKTERPAEEERPEEQAFLQLQRHYFPDRFLWPARPKGLAPDGTNPVYMKEVTCEVFGRGTGLVRAILVGTLVASMATMMSLFFDHPYIFFGFLNLVMLLIAPAFAAVAFTQERERGTYDLLRTSLLTPGAILRGKFLAIARFLFVLLLFLLVPLVVSFVGLATGGSEIQRHPESVLVSHAMNLGIVLATLLVSTATGLLASLVFRRSAGAIVGAYSAVFLFGVAPVAVFAVLNAFTQLPAAWLLSWGMTSPFLASFSVPGWDGQREFFAGGAIPALWWHYPIVAVVATGAALGFSWRTLRREDGGA